MTKKALITGTTICPVIKKLWTPSWAFYSGAVVLWVFALFYWFIDIKGHKAWTFPLVVVGMNSIAIYFGHEVLSSFFPFEFQVPDNAALAMALIENIQRENLNPIDEALAYRRLADEFARAAGGSFRKEKGFYGDLAKAGQAYVLKPSTYMNRSGQAVAARRICAGR